MSPKAPPIIFQNWFRGFISLRREVEPTQFIGRVMGSAHTQKCLHTRRNRVCCHKNNNPRKLPVYRSPKTTTSPVGSFNQNLYNIMKILAFFVYRLRGVSAA
jgi:hypothetical protein